MRHKKQEQLSAQRGAQRQNQESVFIGVANISAQFSTRAIANPKNNRLALNKTKPMERLNAHK